MLAHEIDSSWTLFLDRDGVINRRIMGGYVKEPAAFHFLPHVLEGLKRLAPQFSHIVIVTNQQGVGKGLMTEDELEIVHHYMLKQFKENGIKIDKIYCATNLKGAENDRRKPLPIMALEAKADFPEIVFEKSIFVGDTTSDIQFGMNLGMKTVMISTGEMVDLTPGLGVRNLKELADELEK